MAAERLRKCKVKGCKRMARLADYWYCQEHRVWLTQYREYRVEK